MTTRILITGSRNWTDRDVVFGALAEIVHEYAPAGVIFVHGDCPKGADRMARDFVERYYAESSSVKHEPHPADWDNQGNAAGPINLLTSVSHLGKKRSVGLGRVLRWTVEMCERWDGFPVVREGKPLRTLPPDWPGLEDPDLAYRTLSFPYFDHGAEQLCAVP